MTIKNTFALLAIIASTISYASAATSDDVAKLAESKEKTQAASLVVKKTIITSDELKHGPLADFYELLAPLRFGNQTSPIDEKIAEVATPAEAATKKSESKYPSLSQDKMAAKKAILSE